MDRRGYEHWYKVLQKQMTAGLARAPDRGGDRLERFGEIELAAPDDHVGSLLGEPLRRMLQRVFEWQPDGECAASAFDALHLDAPAVALNDVLHVREPNPAANDRVAHGGRSVEALKDALQVLLADADSVVGDR